MALPKIEFKEKYCDDLIIHMESGLSFESFAGVVSISRATLYNWRDEHEDFKKAQEIGTQKSLLMWEGLGKDHIIEDKDSPKLNAAIYRLNMSNRFGWTTNTKNEVTVKKSLEDILDESFSDDEE